MSSADGSVDTTVSALRERMDGPLYTLVRFDPEAFEVLYVADETREMYPDDSAMGGHFERIFDYVGIDFAERALFTDVLLSGGGDVRYMTTSLESVKVVRAYEGDDTGVFLAVDPEETVPPLVETVSDHLL